MRSEISLKHLHVAVTRPEDQAKSLCEAITQLGGEAITFPLLALKVINDYSAFDAQVAKLHRADWAIFISSNAVEFAMPRVLQQIEKLPNTLHFAAIGPQTADALMGYGIHQVLIPEQRYDTETLLSLPEMRAITGKKVIIFRGVGGRELMADTLKARGADVSFAESYQRYNPQIDTQLLDNCWRQHRLDAIVVTSSEAMRYLLDMAANAPWIKHVTFCVNHARIAELPQALGLKVAVADAPGDNAMLKCLSTLVKHDD